jgi:microsomal prostaglandin-E synthase 2
VKWNEWVDKDLALKLPPNIYNTIPEAFEAFKYISQVPNWSFISRFYLRVTGSLFMRFFKKKMMKKYNFKSSNPRDDLYETINFLSSEIKDKDFITGNKIALCDLIVFGVLRYHKF